jgi:hypothetical protein
MRYLTVLVMALACASCSTPGDVAGKVPFATYSTARSAADVAGCIAPKVAAEWPQTHVLPVTGGQRILASGSAWGDVIAAVDVKSAVSGSSIEVRQGSGRMGVIAGVNENVKACL